MELAAFMPLILGNSSFRAALVIARFIGLVCRALGHWSLMSLSARRSKQFVPMEMRAQARSAPTPRSFVFLLVFPI